MAGVFGLTHWNNTSPEFIIYYILFATIAGIAYGYTWRKTGLFGAALLHTTVDWIWAFYFK
ncbi:MAG: CPBP family glutamic-type intramembrane protease [Candidatus Heimdallarchaeota archaeon]